jgi:hypothetical protein
MVEQATMYRSRSRVRAWRSNLDAEAEPESKSEEMVREQEDTSEKREPSEAS